MKNLSSETSPRTLFQNIPGLRRHLGRDMGDKVRLETSRGLLLHYAWGTLSEAEAISSLLKGKPQMPFYHLGACPVGSPEPLFRVFSSGTEDEAGFQKNSFRAGPSPFLLQPYRFPAASKSLET